ncbi:MAG TPA: hypothetical protein VMF58_16820 [Rhizomicrobium sp.]|nr:hypothetical protein [Rhizomicrobium sp.]
MRRGLFSLACAVAVVVSTGAASASVDDAQTAIRIAKQVCAHIGGLIPKGGFHWQARLEGDTWKVWTVERGDADLVMAIPRHGPAPTRCHTAMD